MRVTGAATISPVGPDYLNTCAAIRAGIRRPAELPYYDALDPDTLDALPVIGYPIMGYTEGFYGLALWVRIAELCLAELVRNARLPDSGDQHFWSRTGLFAVTPRLTDERFGIEEAVDPADVKDLYFRRLLGIWKFPIGPSNLYLNSNGHAGTISALRECGDILDSGLLDRMIVIAVDSYLDPMTLDALTTSARLRTSELDVGLIPGEAGACILVERNGAHLPYRPNVIAVLEQPSVEIEERHFRSGKPNHGIALAKAATRALADGAQPFRGLVVSDLNGEEWRAQELGWARSRLAKNLAVSTRNFLYPAISTGETGAASAAVSICAAIHYLTRDNTLTDALVLSSSETGEVGAVRITHN